MGEQVDQLPPPTVAPQDRDPEEYLPTSAYRPGDEVWVHHRQAGWCPGVVTIVGAWGLQVRYELPGGGGGAVDTVMPDRVARRAAAGKDGQR